MASLIEELQRAALDQSVKVSDLLRRAKLVATKLGHAEFLKWVDQELSGFDSKVPEYRMLTGQPQAKHPSGNWVPIALPGDLQDTISRSPSTPTAAELEDILSGQRSGQVAILYPPQGEELLRQVLKVNWPIALAIDRSQLVGILEAIRTAILDWSLKLEGLGIKGEGFSFSDREKAAAQNSPIHISIGTAHNIAANFAPVTGNVSINQTNGVDLKAVADLIAQIDKLLPSAGLGADVEKRTAETIAELKEALTRPTPEPNKIGALLKSLRTIMEGAAGNVVAEGIIAKIGGLLGGLLGS